MDTKTETCELDAHTLVPHMADSLAHTATWYWSLVAVVGIMLASHTWNQRWQGDFWQHSACIRELSLHPLSPGHPHVPVDMPHEFYNPYSLLLGLMARASGVSSITVLSIAGIVNLAFFAWALRRFCLRLSTNQWCAMLVFLCTLVLWGYNPWMFSGFGHLAMLGDTAQYPSYFCAALTLLTWSLYVDSAVARGGSIRILLLAIPMFVVLVSHPHTAVALQVGMVALWCGVPHNRRGIKAIALAGAFICTGVAALVWPYYSLYNLAVAGGGEHYAGNRWMYVHVVRNTFASLVFLPCVIGRFHKNRRDPIALMFAGLFCTYVLGYASGKYAFGRTIVFIMFCLHFSVADWLAGAVATRGSGHIGFTGERVCRYVAIAILGVFTTGFFAAGIYRYHPGRECTYSHYTFLRDYTGRDSIIMTDLATSAFVPSLGGKVVATCYIAAFVKDDATRKEAAIRFFREDTTDTDRRSILTKYRVDFVLLNEDAVTSERVQEAVAQLGHIVYRKDSVLLIGVRDTRVSIRMRNTRLDGLRLSDR